MTMNDLIPEEESTLGKRNSFLQKDTENFQNLISVQRRSFRGNGKKNKQLQF